MRSAQLKYGGGSSSRSRRKPAPKTTNRIGELTKTIGQSGFSGFFRSEGMVGLLKVFCCIPRSLFTKRELAKVCGAK